MRFIYSKVMNKEFVTGRPLHTRIQSTYQAQTTTFLPNQYETSFQIHPDIFLLHIKVENDCLDG